MKFRIDGFTLLLLGAIVLATFLPVRGEAAEVLSVAGSVAVGLLFFLHGAALSRQQIVEGATHWRLHIVITCLTFILFPLMVLPINELSGIVPEWMPEDLGLGFLYLGVLPSAVSSSIAYTAMARGNVPAAICSAAASNVFGMMLTPFLLILLVSTAGSGDFSVLEALRDIVLQLLLPFAVGHGFRPLLGGFLARHENLAFRYDQCVIWLIVYSAFSHSVVSGLWENLPISAIVLTIVLCFALLGFFMLVAHLLVRRFGFTLEDEAAVVFCGSKKSLASGLPMAKVLFSGHPGFGMIVLPIMCYNQIQVIVGAMLAQRYRRLIEAKEENRGTP
ncbi:solute carrier family 10 (sodium/bile acid cotransporter), member 7 [Marinobacter daqiaonensis]|uniref:Solute carrier family 10 (Sodium/bile acid cotransporter), member 7 n=1 Tax=Marinobacter daqiaonensis TaxID=650891 RepID=A0A1I6GPM7_9GAMM|nr:bile acid:sodium symporter family protein [Marinobacter daqiaonensis]SFR44150.1 solute carrier family 10 (sodium/bile acid cotransporter), member 7 [Marinobacter daqiaonensis]